MDFPRWKLERVVNRVLGEIVNEVARGESVTFAGFGTFRTKTRNARSARHPISGDLIQIPEKAVVEFRPGKRFRERIAVVKV